MMQSNDGKMPRWLLCNKNSRLLEEVKHKNRRCVYSREGSNMFAGKVRD
ncbi:MAG: hypothetical protein ACLSS0_06765 [Clostridioides difficile]